MNMTTINIVTLRDGQAVTSSDVIANGVDYPHKNVIQQVRKYLSDLESFGRVEFKILPFQTGGGTQKREVAVLNEHQAALLMTFMKNTDHVRRFKKALVKAFFELRDQAALASVSRDSYGELLASHVTVQQCNLELLQQQVSALEMRLGSLNSPGPALSFERYAQLLEAENTLLRQQTNRTI